jgi:F-type H+-transporting ATPase subunit a
MEGSGLAPPTLFQIGPIEVTRTVFDSAIASGVLIAFAVLVRLGLGRRSSRWPVAAELLVEHFEDLMREMLGCDPRPYTPIVVTLALFIATANLLGLAPALRSPTADFSATAALAVVVFLAVPYFGIRARGVRGYLSEDLVIAVLLSLAGFLVPVPIMLLAVLTSVVQAYIFAVLTVVYLSAAVRAQQPQGESPS